MTYTLRMNAFSPAAARRSFPSPKSTVGRSATVPPARPPKGSSRPSTATSARDRSTTPKRGLRQGGGGHQLPKKRQVPRVDDLDVEQFALQRTVSIERDD